MSKPHTTLYFRRISLIRLLLVVWLLCGRGLSAWAEVSLPEASPDVEPGYATVLVYHRFDESRYLSTNIDCDAFERQLAWLRQQDATVLTAGELVGCLRRGEPLPPKTLVLTVDDAYLSFYQRALPLLRRYGYAATLFVNTDSVGQPGYMSWEQLRLAVAQGIEIGNHSASHAAFVELLAQGGEAGRQQVAQDLMRAQQQLRTHLGRAAKLFAYPYGEYSPEYAELLVSLGFDAAFGQQSGPVAVTAALFSLPRFPMGGVYASLQELQRKQRLRPLPVELTASVSPLRQDRQPPLLRFRLAPAAAIASASLRCYVQGQDALKVQVLDEEAGLFQVQATRPLQGRRNKYTLTAQSRDGRHWYWFSQPWILPGR